MKFCKACGDAKPLEAFHKDARASDGRYRFCKPCRNAEMRNYYAKNPEKIRARTASYFEKNREAMNAKRRAYRFANLESERIAQRNYEQLHPEKARYRRSKNRAKRKNAETFHVTTKEMVKLLSRPCAYCEKPSEHLDHIVPLTRGGAHSIGNLIGACGKCNNSKGAKTVMEWRLWQSRKPF